MKKALALIAAIILTAVTVTACGIFGSKEELSLDKTELQLTVGETAQLSAGNASKVKWSSGDENIATVHGGLVSAKSAGSTDITASLEDGSSQVCRVTVMEKEITSITLSVKSIRLGLGKTVQISASYSPADASVAELSWSSEDESVAYVDEKGFVTGLSDGSTSIVCRASNGIESTCAVKVEEAPEQPTGQPETQAGPSKPTSAPTEKEDGKKSETKAVTPAYSGDFVFPESSTRMLSESEVRDTLASMTGASVSGSFSQDAVNEIFARHGYVFKTASIKAYYESKDWYSADPDFSMSELSDIEEHNIAIFNKY